MKSNNAERILLYLKNIQYKFRESDGETVVRIMTKKCYSFKPNNVQEKIYDWCQIDPKKY